MTGQLERLSEGFSYDNVFVTGATGILGSQILKQLLERTDKVLYCLVRADDTEAGADRLRSSLKVYDPAGRLEKVFRERVKVVLGDVVNERFGLSEADYATLASTIDVTIHVAALTDLFLNFRRIEPVNVRGTAHVIDFVLQTGSKYLGHVSTHTVTGDKTFDGSVRFFESDLDIGQGFDHMSYQKSKFIAEKMVHAATERGLKWNIYRPGQIFGESRTGLYPLGHSAITGLFYDIFKTVIESRVAFISNTHFDVVPVDYVAQGIIELSLNPTSYFGTYHLTNPDIRTYTEVISGLRDLGYPIRHVAQEQYREWLLGKGYLSVDGVEYKSATTSAFRWWFKRDIDFSESAVTDCTFTRNVLEKRGVYCPPINGQLLGTYIRAGLVSGYFRAETPQEAQV